MWMFYKIDFQLTEIKSDTSNVCNLFCDMVHIVDCVKTQYMRLQIQSNMWKETGISISP
jgi:hypothetical protein